MTLFLTLVCGVLIVILFAQTSGMRKIVTEHGKALGILLDRIEVLETRASTAPAPAPAASQAAESPARPEQPPVVVRPEPPVATPPPVVEPGPYLPLPDRQRAPRHRPLPDRERPATPARVNPAASAAPEQPEMGQSAPSRTPAPPVRPVTPAGPGLGDRIAAQLRIGWDQWIAQNLLAVTGGIFVLLGASFFVAVAISNGWLTPWRQVVAALIGGGLLLVAGWRAWPGDASKRAAHILSQSLVGTGAGVMLLGIVAGARIYEQPLYPTWVGLIGAGAISALVVAIAVRWNAQVTAGLGIITAVAAPLLVDAPPTTGTILFLLLALAGSGCAIAFRGWPWLLQVAIIASLPQPAMWAFDDHLSADQQPTAVALGVIVAWWALLALPALLFETRADSTRLRMPTSSALFQVAGLAALFGRIEFGSVHAAGFQALLCVLAACHLVAGAVMLQVRPSSRHGAVFVWAIGAALAAGAAAVILGGAAQPAFWGVEALAMLWLYVRFADRQAGVMAALLGALTAGWSLYLAPPAALAHSLPELATGVLALAALVVMLGGAAFLLRRTRDAAIAFAVSAWVALFYFAGVLVVGLVAPHAGPVDQTAQLWMTGVWAVLATAGCLGALVLPQRYRDGVRIVAELSLWVVAAKALAIDSFALGIHETGVLWLLGALGALSAVLVVIERRMPQEKFPLPLATPFAALLVISGLTQPGFDAYRAGTPHLLETLAVLGIALAASLLALWRYPMARRADALAVAVLLVVEGLALATVTIATPHLGVTSENALRAVSVGPLVLGLLLLGGAMLVRRLPEELRTRSRYCAGGVIGLSALLTVGNTSAFGATGGALVVAGFWLAAVAVLGLSLRRRPGDDLLLAATAVAVAMCAFALVTTAPPDALAYGATHGWWALAAAAIAAAAAAFAAICVPVVQRSIAVAAASTIALYGASVLVVTALTPHADHVSQTATQTAQLVLAVVWTIWGVALLGAGVFRAPNIGVVLRAKGMGVLAIAAALTVVDTLAFGTGEGLTAVAAVWLAATGAIALAARRRPEQELLLLAGALAVGVCAFALVATAPPQALAYGAAEGWWALATAAIATAAAVVAAICAPARWRIATVCAAHPRRALRRLRPGRDRAHAGRRPRDAGGAARALGRVDGLGRLPAGRRRRPRLAARRRAPPRRHRTHRNRGREGAAGRHGALRHRAPRRRLPHARRDSPGGRVGLRAPDEAVRARDRAGVTPRGPSVQDVHRARGHEHDEHERRERLDGHQQLRRAGDRHRVGRAEGRRVRARRVEVVGEGRLPVRHQLLGVGHLREQEVRRIAVAVLAGARPPTVELPEPEREHEHVREPHEERAGEQLPPAHLRAAGQQLAHEQHQRRAVGGHGEAEQAERQHPVGRMLAPLGVGDRQRDQCEHGDDREHHTGSQ